MPANVSTTRVRHQSCRGLIIPRRVRETGIGAEGFWNISIENSTATPRPSMHVRMEGVNHFRLKPTREPGFVCRERGTIRSQFARGLCGNTRGVRDRIGGPRSQSVASPLSRLEAIYQNSSIRPRIELTINREVPSVHDRQVFSLTLIQTRGELPTFRTCELDRAMAEIVAFVSLQTRGPLPTIRHVTTPRWLSRARAPTIWPA
jgi:hypothetical protein